MSRACNILWVVERTLCEILRHRPIFNLQLCCFPKKNRSSLEISPNFLTFCPKFMVFIKKKCHHFKSFPDFLLFHSNFFSNQFTFPNFVPNQLCFLFCLEIKVIGQEFVGNAKHVTALQQRLACPDHTPLPFTIASLTTKLYAFLFTPASNLLLLLLCRKCQEKQLKLCWK